MNWNTPTKDNLNSLIVIAHPDDETIFCGGTLLSFPKWNWTIVCVTMQQNSPRPQEFDKAINMYKSFGVNISSHSTLNKPDENQDLSTIVYEDWKNSINQLDLRPDITITHNVMGEYGHKHHLAVSKIVRELFTNVWEFVYPGDPSITPQPRKSIVNEVNLNFDILSKKRRIYETCYTSQAYIRGLLPELMKYEFEHGPEIFTTD